MFIALCRIELYLPASRSLKAKRSAIQRVKGRLIQRFQASVAEVDHQELWKRSGLGLALVGSSSSYLRERLQQVRRLVDAEHDLMVVAWSEEVQRFDLQGLARPPVPEAPVGRGDGSEPGA